MDLDLLSDLTIDQQPALSGNLLSILSRTPHPNVSSSSSPNTIDPTVTKIEGIFEAISDCILNNKKQMSIQIKRRKKVGNQAIDADTGVIKNVSDEGTTTVHFPSKSAQEAWKFTALLRILELSHEALVTGIVTTKRDMYYRDPELFIKQAVVDRYVDDLAYTLGVERDALNVVAAAKGLVAGTFSITRKDDSTVNYSSELEGMLVPNVKEIKSIDLHDTKWILIIEKEATFRTLSMSQYYKHSQAGNGIILTAKGYPDISTRQLLFHLSTTTDLPIFTLVDYDPDGLGIMSTYKYGSIALAHENASLAVPRIRWLGVKSTDIFYHEDGINNVKGEGKEKVGLLKLTARDRRIARRMLEKECFEEDGREQEWRRELLVMLMLNVKAEIQVLSDGGLEGWIDKKLRDEVPLLEQAAVTMADE